jgi:hypothetical protein
VQKACSKCGTGFEITQSDLDFYDKVSPMFGGKKCMIPPPKLCPDCRLQRRVAWRNERFMYKRKCDATGKDIISMYPPDSPFKIYEQSVWWSDSWNALDYGRDFDFNRPFFEQFRELQLEVPRLALVNKNSHNSQYTNHAGDNKDCYLSATIFESEDIYYSDWVIDHCRDLVDCSYVMEGCELCYEIYYGWGSYQAFFSEFTKRCQNIWFCYDCMNCKHCFLCSNLRNKEYCFENNQLTKEEYEKKIKSLLPWSHSNLKEYKTKYIKMKEGQAVHPAIYQVQSLDSSGDLLFQTENCQHCFDIIGSKDCRYCQSVIDVKDCLDIYHVGWAELMYECHAISNGYQCFACHFTYDNSNSIYCDCTQNCKNVFGCCSLNQQEYCIMNKKYSKDEYNSLVPKIIEHMQNTGEWGEFFPMEYSPFAYNQSRAPEFIPITKEEAKSKNIRWSDYVPPAPDSNKTILASNLPEMTSDIPDDVLDWAIKCEITSTPYQIIRKELEFYRKSGLPIPRRHPNQRYIDRISMRTPWKLFNRKCDKCSKEIESTHSPEKPEKIYCEKCYLKEVY